MNIQVVILIMVMSLAGCSLSKKTAEGAPETSIRSEAKATPKAKGPTTQPPDTGPVIHIVKAGENISGIARRYGVTVKAICEANQIANPDFIRINQKLVIPKAGKD